MSKQHKNRIKESRAKYFQKIGYSKNIFNIHKWLRRKYNSAYYCFYTKCSKKSKTFDYANISGIHDNNIKHYIPLCRSCHKNFDHGNLTYIYLLAQSKL